MKSILLGVSIRARLVRVLLLVGLTPLAAIALYVAISQRSALFRTGQDNLENHALLEASSIERVVSDAAADVAVLAANPVLRSPAASREEKARQLAEAQEFFELFEDITLIDPGGTVIDSTTYLFYGTWADKAWFKEALAGHPAMSEVHLIPSPERLVTVFTAPVVEQGRTAAVVAGQMNMERIWTILDEVTIGKTGYLVAVDGNGTIVSHPDKTLLLTELDADERPGESETTSIALTSGPDGGALTGQAAPVNETGWKVIALQDSAEAEALANDALRTLTIVGAVAAAVTVLGSIILSGAIAGPIQRLAGGMAKISDGDLDYRLPRAPLKELNDLSISFNRMAANLEVSTQQLNDSIVELQLRNKDLVDARWQAATDGLTELSNHRALQNALAAEVNSAIDTSQPVAVLMMDINDFKLFNDSYGHLAGDNLLRQVAGVLKKTLRTRDIVGRYGGDEFMAILPDTDREGATAMANRLLDAFAEERVQAASGSNLPLALSIGLAVCPADSRHKSELLAYADASLYEAKQVSGSSLRIAHREPGELVGYQDTHLGIIDSLVQGIDAKDRYTQRHSQLDAELAADLGAAIGLSEASVRALRISGLLHDVGKIGVANHILKKPGPLTNDEREQMQNHVILSRLIVQGIPSLRDVRDAVFVHHERWDGTGYPRRLKGDEIPLLGRILAVADAYSAMVFDRPYRKALTHDEAVAELRRCAGTQFDPELIEPFIRLLHDQHQTAA